MEAFSTFQFSTIAIFPYKILQKHCFQFLFKKLKTQIGEHKLSYEGSECCSLEMTADLMFCFADLRRF